MCREYNLRSPEVDASDGDISKSRDLSKRIISARSLIKQHITMVATYTFTLDRGLDSAVDANDVHDKTLCDTSPQQTATSAKRIGHKDKEDSNSGQFDDTVDTSGEQRGVSTSQAETLEDLRSIVVL